MIKCIKLHRKLRVKQEISCQKLCLWSQDNRGDNPHLNELSSLNKAVKNIEAKLPNIYFIVSDIIGTGNWIRKKSRKELTSLGFIFRNGSYHNR